MQTDEARIEERITTIVRGPDGKVKLSGPEVKVGANFALLTGGKRSEWFNYGWYYHDRASKIQEPTNYRKFIELGTWKGHSICYLAKSVDGIGVVYLPTVDPLCQNSTDPVLFTINSSI